MRHLCLWPALGLILVSGCGLFLPSTSPSDIDFTFNAASAPTPVRITDEPVFSDEPLFESIPGMSGHHAAAVTAFPDGELLAAWYSYPGEDELAGSAIYTARKRPADSAWSAPALLIDRPQGDGNPVLYSEGDAVWLFQAVVPFGWSSSHIEFQTSPDRGHTWSDPRLISYALGSNTRFPPLRLADGSLLLPAYDDLRARSLFFCSPDGQDWSFRSAVETSPPNLQPSVVRLPGGRLLAVMRNPNQGFLWAMASDDNAQSWSVPRDSGFPNPGSAAELLGLADGNLVLIFNDSPTDRHPLSIALSCDQGQSWPFKRTLIDGPLDYSYPAAIQTPDGLIHILYSFGRQVIRHITLNEAWIAAGNE